MGERHSGDGLSGRGRAHPHGTVAAPAGTSPGGSDLETRFGAVLRAESVDPEGERAAVAAFRAAREAGAHDARTRARDDWRPGRPRRARRSLRTTLSLALASLTLGGVAVAAIGSAGSGRGAEGRDASRSARPSASVPSVSAGASADGAAAGRGDPGSAGPSERAGRPATTRDTLARCRAWAQAGERGGALEATAWQRLVTAAGGREKVADYCAAQEARAQGEKAGKPGDSGKSGESGNSGGAGKGEGKGETKGGSPGKPAGGKR
ncbi:hypothetical protein CFC35_15605 [Streptomyces sp. FBKL.4005]|uniref:hypothetical protein n=1 Tax=Streptomyces sp. FBKL.4005 TaxID=2015515 RepID=UPI000B9782DF|nr:hypothetical protein [Streptomyces sp. FBKL.4005]OYP15753.1 hypothetical protein CFC35_15605 [Streptomyces sp. FBKL.4005]